MRNCVIDVMCSLSDLIYIVSIECRIVQNQLNKCVKACVKLHSACNNAFVYS